MDSAGFFTNEVDDDGRQAGPMRAREDFEPTAKIITSLRQEQGRQNSYIPKNERARQRPFDEAWRSELELAQPKLENSLIAIFFLLIILDNTGGETNTKTLNGEIKIG